MTLKPDSSLGPYRIISPLGAGGMGEVYRARDTKLNREVALKVLPEEFSRDSQHMARFQREAQVLASFNHPHIAAIHGLEESGSIRAIVMELVEGPTLAERILQGPIPVDEALPIARQIAEALEYAHERGIIHRDLKPANIKITPEGAVKVLDFGLAKAVEGEVQRGDSAQSPTLSIAATQAGIILGTARYMSPEQAKGKPVDRRADIWAFGVVTYEMLTGRAPFEGETVSETLAHLLMKEPSFDALPDTTPLHIRALLRRCLTKDPRQRLRDIGDARLEIELPPPESSPTPARTAGSLLTLQRAIPVAMAALVLLALALAAGMWLQSRRATPPPVYTGTLLTSSITAMGPRISPDGQTLAFQAMIDGLTQVAVMKPDSGNWTVLTHDRSQGYVFDIRWSPDGESIYFDRWIEAPRGIFRIPAVGGTERLVLEDAISAGVLADGSLLVVRVNPERFYQLHRFWPETGRLQILPAIVDTGNVGPVVGVFPDGKEAVFFGSPNIEQAKSDPAPHFYLLDITSGSTRRMTLFEEFHMGEEGTRAIAIRPNGKQFLATVKSGDLFETVAIPRSGDGRIDRLLSLTLPSFSLNESSDGSFYFDQIWRPLEVVRIPLAGGIPERLASNESYLGSYTHVQFPDRRVLFSSGSSGRGRLMVFASGREPIALMDTKEETAGPVALIGEREVALILGSGANQSIAIVSVKDGRIIRRLTETTGKTIVNMSSSLDGKSIYYESGGSIWTIPATGGAPVRIGSGDSLAIDSDGKNLVVQLNEKERSRIVRLPLMGGRPEDIPWNSELRLTNWPLSSNAVAKDGRILVTVGSPDSWFFSIAVLDPKTGKVEKVPTNYVADLGRAGWANDGRIIAYARPLRAAIWRFRNVSVR